MIGALLLFSSLNFSNLTPKIDVAQIVDSVNANVPMDIATDSAFSRKTQNFNSGQTIYVRITTDNEGSSKHNLNVHDSNYNILSTYQLNRSGNQFSVNFPAPQSAGTYSLEVNIVSGGSVLNLVKTITVGGGGNTSAKVKVENKINSNNQNLSNASSSPAPLSSSTPMANPEAQKPNFFFSVWLGILGFFRKIF